MCPFYQVLAVEQGRATYADLSNLASDPLSVPSLSLPPALVPSLTATVPYVAVSGAQWKLYNSPHHEHVEFFPKFPPKSMDAFRTAAHYAASKIRSAAALHTTNEGYLQQHYLRAEITYEWGAIDGMPPPGHVLARRALASSAPHKLKILGAAGARLPCRGPAAPYF